MDYFNFQDAADEPQDTFPDFASDQVETNQEESNECVDSLWFDKSFTLPSDPTLNCTGDAYPPTSLANDEEAFKIGGDGVYPLYRPKEPCDRCRNMGLECFLAHRGTFVNGCTICISMYRECSFTHKKPTGHYMDTLATLTEDTQELVGGLTGRKTLKSLTYTPSALDVSERPKKAGARFGREATKILKTWLAAHAHHPYPTEDEKHELKQRTGLKRSQISNWLANARRRGKVPPISDASSPVIGAIDIPNSQNRNGPDLSELDPFERWKISPPEHEAASATAIAKAIQSPPFTPTRNPSQAGTVAHSRQTSTRRTSSNDDSTYSMFQAPSISSFDNETNRSSMSEFSHLSANTGQGSIASKDRRRRRRNPLGARSGTPGGQGSSGSKSRPARIFQCTFCADSFPSKYDWQRHEKSLHLALERWMCAPKGPTIINESTGAPICVFCQRPNPSPQHLESHNYLTCADKTASERTFYRKDHLRQHLRLAHGAAFHASIMDAWKSTTDSIRSNCGFCPAKFTSWSARADHLAAHFRNGMDMSNWKGDWGFEPFVARLVENAVPPYLIAQERKTMDPFVATEASTSAKRLSTGGSSSAEPATPSTASLLQHSNCWNKLSKNLREYVSNSLDQGVVPSDAQIQAHARFVVFGDDDPWNQTAADNPYWLGILKRDCGLDSEEIGEASSSGVAAVAESTTMEELRMDPPYAVRGGLRKTTASNYPPSNQQPARTSALGKQRVSGPMAAAMPMASSAAATSMPISMNMPSSGAPIMDPMDFEFDLGQLDLDEIPMDMNQPQHGQMHSQFNPSLGLGMGTYESVSTDFNDPMALGMLDSSANTAADFNSAFYADMDTRGFGSGTQGEPTDQQQNEFSQYQQYGYGHGYGSFGGGGGSGTGGGSGGV